MNNESRFLIVGDEGYKYGKGGGYNECCDASLNWKYRTHFFQYRETDTDVCGCGYVYTYAYNIHICVCVHIMNSTYIYLLTLLEGLEVTPTPQ